MELCFMTVEVESRTLEKSNTSNKILKRNILKEMVLEIKLILLEIVLEKNN